MFLLLLFTFKKLFFFNRCCCCWFCSPTVTALLYCPTPGRRYQDLKIKQENCCCVLTGIDHPFLHTLLLLCCFCCVMWNGEDAEDEKTLVRCLVALTKLNDEAKSRTALSLSPLPFLFLAGRRKRNSEEVFVVVTATSLL